MQLQNAASGRVLLSSLLILTAAQLAQRISAAQVDLTISDIAVDPTSLASTTTSQNDLGQELYPQSLTHVCHLNHTKNTLQLPSKTANGQLQDYRETGVGDAACLAVLKSFQSWQWQRLSMTHKFAQGCTPEGRTAKFSEHCQHSIHVLKERMPEDWDYEEGIRRACKDTADTLCPGIHSGYATLTRCLRSQSQHPAYNCSLPRVGGFVWQHLHARQAWKVAIVSTFPPKQCGLATFTASLLGALRSMAPRGTTFGVVVLSDPRDDIVYEDPAVDYELRLDRQMPSPAMLQAVHFIHKAGYSHVIIQQEFGVTPIMWQLADLARWLDPQISLLTVVHSPRATPNLEERGVLREFARHSKRLVVMTWFGWHSLVAAYGIPPEQVVFIPHGVDVPKEISLDQDTPTMPVRKSRSLLRQLLARYGMPGHGAVILANGLITGHKRLDRVIRALPGVLLQHPHTMFVVLGAEHPAARPEEKPMAGWLLLASVLGVRKRVLWLPDFVHAAELMRMLRRACVFITPFDESTPTSGTLLMAMANGLPVVSIPYRFALEVLQQQRGLLVPFADDGPLLQEAMCRLLDDEELRSSMGQRAQDFVRAWSWKSVAAQYLHLHSQEPVMPLSADPFNSDENNGGQLNLKASWVADNLTLFSGAAWEFSRDGKPADWAPGLYALYADVDIQVNARVGKDGVLLGAGLLTKHVWVMADQHGIRCGWRGMDKGLDRVTPPLSPGRNASCSKLTAIVSSQNAEVFFNIHPASAIGIFISIHDGFARPLGMLGSSHRNFMVAPIGTGYNLAANNSWVPWRIPDNSAFSLLAPGQNWHHVFDGKVRSNTMNLDRNLLPTEVFETELELQPREV